MITAASNDFERSHHPAELRVAVVRFSLMVAAVLVLGVPHSSAQAVPAPWQSADIGAVGFPGSATYDAGTFTVTGSGADIWGSADQFHFEYVELPYDGYLEARVTGVDGTQAWAKAGVMIRQSLDPNSRHDSFFLTPGNGPVYQRRLTTGGPSFNNSLAPHGVPAAPLYVRIFRQSQFVSLQFSGDGVNWAGTGGGDWGMGTVYVGLAVTSHTNTPRAIGTFDNVRVEVRPANTPSDVAITQPAEGEVFFAPARVPITVNASDPDYGIKEVGLEMQFGETWSGFATFYTSDGWRSPYTTTTRDLSAGTYRIRARVVDNQNGITYSDPVSFRVTDGSLPGEWRSTDIGAVGAAGSFADGDPVVVKGAGADIWNSSDAFHYAYQQVTGDWEIVVRVGSIDNVQAWTKAGVMFRESLEPGSKHVSWFATAGKGLAFQVRRGERGPSFHTAGPVAYAPVWLRLVRRGNTFAAYYRHLQEQGWRLAVADGGTVTMPETIYVGMAVTSHQAGTLATATFDSVRSEHVAWSSTDIGSVGAAGSVTDRGSYVSIDASGADIWNTADAFHFFSRGWEGDASIAAFVFSLENTHAWAKAGVMLRESLAPGSKYVTLVATPGKGIAMQARSIDGRQSADVAFLEGTIPKWVRLIRRGDIFTGSVSDDGLQWRNVGAVRVPMNTMLRAGLAVTSHAAGTLATAIFQSEYVER
jgi:regulation of enolase protein 1 (concanavalin A-like superfamily)